MTTTDCQTEHYYVGALIDGRYRLNAFVGAGGMACVYKATEFGTPHEYAIKFLRAQYRQQDYLIRFFEQEASNMRDLAHPNIVRFYRFVNTDFYSYIIMDYVDGYALSDIIKRVSQQQRHIPLDEVVRIMVQVARALDAIHREGFVHRDIKPSNVLIQKSDGKAFLSDLGITTTTQTQMHGAGTAAYMAPEQATDGIADQRTDIYAYGVMLFEILCQKRPYLAEVGLKGDAAEKDLVQKHRSAPIPNITDYRKDLPPALNDIMKKALAKNPNERYDNIITLVRDVHGVLRRELAEDMQDFAQITHLSGRLLTAEIPLALEPTPTNPVVLFGAVALILLGLMGFALLLLTNNPAPVATATSQVAVVQTMSPTQRQMTATTLAVGGPALTVWPTESLTPTETLTPSHTPTSTATPTATNTPTSTATPTSTDTPTPRPTATNNPIERQPIYPFLQGREAVSLPDAGDTLSLAPLDGPLRYLRVGFVDGFQLELDALPNEAIIRYGVVFRLQDAQNYLRLSISTSRGDWRLDEVIDGLPTTLRAGSLAGEVFGPIRITGRGDFFQFTLGNNQAEHINSRWPTGSLGLWIESENNQPLQLEELRVSLIGPESILAVTASPTPADGIGDPFRFLRADVNALMSANNIVTSTIDCPTFIRIYETLNRHQQNANSTVRSLANRLERVSEPIYSRCQARSPEEPLSFISGIDDYLDWESAIREIATSLGQ